MKALFVAYDGANYVGGPNVWLRRIVPALVQRGVEVHVLVLVGGKKGELEEDLTASGATVHMMRWVLETTITVRAVLKTIQQIQPDIYVPNLSVSASIAGRWAREAGIPTIVVIHSDDTFHIGMMEEFGRASAWRASALVVVSHELEKIAHSSNPAPDLVIRRIPYVVPVPEAKCSWSAEPFRVVYTGRLVEEQKRISDVARAFVLACRELPHCEATIYGGGIEEEKIRAMLSDAEGATGGRARFGGRLAPAEVESMLLQAQSLALLSDYEGLPISLLEAMACGMVPVCTRIRSGIPELIEDGETGLLVDDREESFVRAVRRLAESRDLWERLSANARAKIEHEYSTDVCVDAWAGLMEELRRAAPRRKAVRVPKPWRVPLPPLNEKLAREDVRRYSFRKDMIGKVRGRLRRIAGGKTSGRSGT